MAVQFVNLEADDLKKSETYLPIARKAAIAKILAAGCIEQVDMMLEHDKRNIQPMPPRWQESTIGKRLVMTYVLAGFYLHKIDVADLMGDTPKFVFSARQYDTFSQIYSQLETFKRDRDQESEVRNAAAAILSDYRDFEKLLNAEVYNQLQQKNDVCSRVVSMLYMQTSPEAVKNAQEALKQIQTEAKEEVQKKQEWLEQVRKEKGA